MKKLDELQSYVHLPQMMYAVLLLVVMLVFLTGIRIYLSVEANRLLRSIDRSLKLLPGVARVDRRVA